MATDDLPIGLKNNPNWRKLWAGQAISLVGDFVFNTTVVLWVATVIVGDQPWAAAAVSAVLIAASVPVLLVAPIAGVFVDRWDRRRTMMITDLIRAALIALLLIVPLYGDQWPVSVQLAMLYTVVLLTSATSQFFGPARFAVIANTVAKEDRPRAFGLSSAASSTAAVIGPPLAAPLLFGTGVQWALIVNVVSFLVSFVLVRSIRLPVTATAPGADKPKRGFWPEFKEGFGFFLHNRMLVVMVGAVCIYMFGVGALNVLDVFFVTENLKVDAGWLGTLAAAFGLGSVLGALSTSRVVKWVGSEVRVFALGIGVTGLLMLVYSRTTLLVVAIAVLLLSGMAVAAVNVVVGPLVLRTTPNHLVGRVSTVMNPLVYVSSIMSMAVAGFLASTLLHDFHGTFAGLAFGRIDTIFLIAGLMMLAAGFTAWSALSKVERQGPAEPLDDKDSGSATPELGEPELAMPGLTEPEQPEPEQPEPKVAQPAPTAPAKAMS